MSWRRAFATYCVAHVGKSLLWTASDLLTLYLLVSVYRLDPMAAGLVFLVGLAANALADLGVGIWIARRPHHAAILAGSGLAVAAAAFPATVLLAPYGPWPLLAATLAFRIAYAGCDVPHNALLTRLGDTPARAVDLSRGRTIGTALASLVAAAAAGGGSGIATAPLLWSIAAAGLAIGSAMLPLLVAFPPLSAPTASSRTGTAWLPLRFLLASVIGIVALGALAKAVLHLPSGWHGGGGSAILTWLILGRTASALLPIRLATPRRGLTVLALAYAAAGGVALGFAWNGGPALLFLLGLALGTTNLIGWAMLPLLGVGPRGYGLYAMVSKLALGAAGLALAGGLGRVPTFSAAGYTAFTLAVALACLVTAALLATRLTGRPPRGLPAR